MSDDIKEVVSGLTKLVIASGRLSEIHEKNLKAYPFIFFEQVSEVKIDYDVSVQHDVDVDKESNLTIKKPKQACHVTYYLTLNEAPNKSGLKRRIETIQNSVKALFWKDLNVNVYLNGVLTNG